MNWENDIYALGKQVNKWPYTEVISAVKRLYPDNKLENKCVAEIGCGSGNNLIFFASEGSNVFGIDFSESAIKIGKAYSSSLGFDVKMEVGDVTQALPWLSTSMDLLIDRGCLTQVPHKCLPRTMKEIFRVLKPGGLFFSFTLFGEESTDLIFGRQVEDYTYDDFSMGYFSKIGLTSVFNLDIINSYWEEFKIIHCNKQTNQNCLLGDSLVTFSVVASK